MLRSTCIDMLDIIDMICAPSILPGEVHFMSEMISHFLERYFTQFEEVSVTPKAHFLTHYGRHILHFGPLVHCWMLRFEAKHNYFKEMANMTIKEQEKYAKHWPTGISINYVFTTLLNVSFQERMN